MLAVKSDDYLNQSKYLLAVKSDDYLNQSKYLLAVKSDDYLNQSKYLLAVKSDDYLNQSKYLLAVKRFKDLRQDCTVYCPFKSFIFLSCRGEDWDSWRSWHLCWPSVLAGPHLPDGLRTQDPRVCHLEEGEQGTVILF